MESHRIVPEGAATPPKKETYIFPLFVAVLLIIDGLFNFTTVTSAFIAVSLITALTSFVMVFVKNYHNKAKLTDSISLSAFCWSVLVCLSSLWAVSPSGAFISLIGYSGAFFFFFLARTYTREDADRRTALSRAVAYAGAVISLLSIEMASTGILRSLYKGPLSGLFGITPDTPEFGLWTEGSRMQSLMGLPNLYATFAAMCFFVALWLLIAGRKRKARSMDIAAAVINGTGFFLAGSRGGVLAFGAAALVFVLYAKKGERRLAMIEWLFFVCWCGVTYLLAIPGMGKGSPMVWLVILASIILLTYSRALFVRLIDWLNAVKAGKLLIIIGGLIVLAVIFAALALNIRSPFPLYTPEAEFRRAVKLEPGEHKLDIAADFWDGGQGISVVITSQSSEQAARQMVDTLLETGFFFGEWNELRFTVPEGSEAVFISMSAIGGKVSVTEVTAGDKKLPLEYALIPENIIRRLQGIWVDANILQRFEYWSDGMKLFSQSPLIGQGGGTFDTLNMSVADSYYVSKHAHNHYIQVLLENGIVGLIVMLATFVFTMLRLWRKKDKLPAWFVPCISGAVSMMMIHSIEEASMHNLLNLAVFFLLLGLVSGACAEERKAGELSKAVVCLYAALIAAILGGRLITQQYVRNAEARGTQDALRSYRMAVITDPLNASSYKSSCLMRYVADPDSGAGPLSERFVEDLRRNWNTPKDCFIVARYYLKSGDAVQAAKYFERYVELCRVDSVAWDEVLSQYYKILNTPDNPDTAHLYEDIRASSVRLRDYLTELNTTLPASVTPNATLMRVLEEGGE